jgi:hypothetical protein
MAQELIAIGREELDHKFAFTTGRFGNREMQVADLARFQRPFRLSMGAASRQRAASWKPAYGDNATFGDRIRAVNGNGEGDVLTGCRLECSRR